MLFHAGNVSLLPFFPPEATDFAKAQRIGDKVCYRTKWNISCPFNQLCKSYSNSDICTNFTEDFGNYCNSSITLSKFIDFGMYNTVLQE